VIHAADTDLRRILDTLIRAALKAADPQEAIRRHVHRDGETLYVDHHRYSLAQLDDIRLIAAGKAAAPMAEQVVELLGDRLSHAVVVTKYGHGPLPSPPPRAGEAERPGADKSEGRSAPWGWVGVEAGHPIPDENSMRGGEAVCEALRNCTERTLVIACVSGGASALLIAPHEGISLGAMRAINDALLRSGADIYEMNAVRSRLDRLKGGGLVRMAQPGKVIGLILSDVVGDPLDVIASGLTNDPRAHNVLVGNNAQACNAVADAARDLGFIPHVVTTELCGEARVRGEEIAAALLRTPPASLPVGARGTCMIYGGETTVTIRGAGKGGRNQELALAAAIALAPLPLREKMGEGGAPRHMAIAALGTDGTDGPTDAAGAIAYSDTMPRARTLGLDAQDFLDRNDSYAFFQQLGDLIMTGPTGTNVADVITAVALDN
jgi:hydroxypyruvate reductase